MMADTSTDPKEEGIADAEEPRRSWWRRAAVVGAVVVAVLVVFHLAGGWYFATTLDHDALDAEARRESLERDYELEVLAIGSGEITLAVDGDSLARRPGVWGVAWPAGYGLVRTMSSSDATSVTRVFELVEGAAPEPGVLVDVNERAFPDDPTAAVGAAPEVVVVDGPLGGYESWFYPGERSTWVLLLHGNGLDRLDLAKVLPALRGAGHPVLFVTMRNDPGAPMDPSGRLRYGDTEWEDLDAAVGYAIEAGAADVVVIAPSMGGGVALSFLERSESVDRVRGLVLDSPLVDFGRAVDAQADDESLPLIGLPVPGTLVGTAKWLAAVRFGVDWDATGHLDETDELTVPVLIFHGTDDDDVPIETSRELAAARPDLVTLIEVEDAPHLASWNLDPVAFETELVRFLDDITDTGTVPEPDPTTTAPPPASSTPPGDEPLGAEDLYSLLGDDPTDFPTDWSIGFLSPRSSRSEIESALGPPDRVDEGPTSWWDLPGGAEVEVGGVSEASEAVVYVRVDIPEASPVRFALAGGVVLGTATFEQLIQAWGEPTVCADIGKTDCDVLYERCLELVTVSADPDVGFDRGARIRAVVFGVNQSPQAWDLCGALGLSSRGLGIADLGQPETTAVTSLVRALGPTSRDEAFEWEEPVGIHNGYPAGLRVRDVDWEDIGLSTVFSDGVRWPDGPMGSVLISWWYAGAPDAPLTLATAEGLTVGSPAGELLEAYSDELTIHPADEYFGWSVRLPSPHPAATPVVNGLVFWLSGDPAEPGTVVTGIEAGAAQAP